MSGTAPLPLSDRAEILADGLGIDTGSYAGREADAVVAMTLVAGYRQMSPADRNQVLYVIRDEMRFGATNPAFFWQCQQAVGLEVVNPAWVPGSLGVGELEDEVRFWRTAAYYLRKAGFAPLGDVALSQGRKMLEQAKGARIAARTLGLGVFGNGAASIAYHSLQDLQAEVKRRGLAGTMTPMQVQEYGQ